MVTYVRSVPFPYFKIAWTIRDHEWGANHAELINIFEIFLPQLLRYPNPADPLNGEAAALLMRDPKAYAKKIESYVERFATPQDAEGAGDGEDDDEDDLVGSVSNRPKHMEKASAAAAASNGHANGNGKANGHVNGASNGSATNGHGKGAAGSNGHGQDEDDEDEDEDEDDKMSDMGELSDTDEFMGEMDD